MGNIHWYGAVKTHITACGVIKTTPNNLPNHVGCDTRPLVCDTRPVDLENLYWINMEKKPGRTGRKRWILHQRPGSSIDNREQMIKRNHVGCDTRPLVCDTRPVDLENLYWINMEKKPGRTGRKRWILHQRPGSSIDNREQMIKRNIPACNELWGDLGVNNPPNIQYYYNKRPVTIWTVAKHTMRVYDQSRK